MRLLRRTALAADVHSSRNVGSMYETMQLTSSTACGRSVDDAVGTHRNRSRRPRRRLVGDERARADHQVEHVDCAWRRYCERALTPVAYGVVSSRLADPGTYVPGAIVVRRRDVGAGHVRSLSRPIVTLSHNMSQRRMNLKVRKPKKERKT